MRFADECIALCTEYDFAQEGAMIMPARGWALTAQGEIQAGISEAVLFSLPDIDMPDEHFEAALRAFNQDVTELRKRIADDHCLDFLFDP